MNKWGYEQKYKNIKESLKSVDEQIEYLLKKKNRLVMAKSRCGAKVKSFPKNKGREFKKKKKQ